MNLNSVTQSPVAGQQITNKPKAGEVNGYQDLRESIDVVVKGLDDEHKQMDKQINEIKTQQVETQQKAKKNSSMGTIILAASAIGCFGLAALFKGSGVPAGLGLLAGIIMPWTFLFLSAKSNAQYHEAAQKNQQVVEVKQKQADVVQQKEWWNEKKEMTEVLETDKEGDNIGKDGKPRKIVDEPTKVIIGGVPLEKRKKG